MVKEEKCPKFKVTKNYNLGDILTPEPPFNREAFALIGNINRCPYIKSKRAGDESQDFCKLSEKPSGRIHPCILVSGGKCEIWEDIKFIKEIEEW